MLKTLKNWIGKDILWWVIIGDYSWGPINTFHKFQYYIYIYIYGFKNIVIINKIIKLFRFFIMPLLFIKGIIL
jgi:hypothetical protein